MTKFKGSLELNWINKDKSILYEIDEEEGMGVKPVWVKKDDIQVAEPRILKLKEEYGDPDNKNILIKGDNLLALRTLVEEFKNRDEKDKVKCIYIDPPYNTGAAFEHYDDNLEHSEWLTMMRDRLVLMKQLLREDGSIWISIDDDEVHYLKVLCDMIFGRDNFINNVIWEKKYTIANDAKWFSDNHDHILVYAKNKVIWRPNRLPRTVEMNKAYTNPDNHPKGPWKSTPLHAKSGSEKNKGFSYTFRNSSMWSPPPGTYPRFSEETLKKLESEDAIWFGKDGDSIPSRKTFLSELKTEGVPPRTIWNHEDVGHNHEAKNEVKEINPDDIFSTPKPERLISRIITLGSNEGDLILDIFAGSGTTGAVSQKNGRKWIMVEIGRHAETHCIPRLLKIISDENSFQKKITKQTGGFRYYQLGDSIIKHSDMNWDMTLEEMSKAVFINFDYSMIEGDTHPLETGGDEFHLGKRRGGIAICLVTKGTKIIRRTELNKLVKYLSKKYPNRKVTIFTNMGVAVKPEELSEKLDVKKIPESILKKYRMV